MDFFDSKECEWADIRVSFEGVNLIKFTGVSWGIKTNKEYVRGAGKKPLHIASGNKEYPVSVTVLKGALTDLNRAVIAAGYDDLTDVPFTVNISFKAKSSRALQNVIVLGFEISEFEEKWTQGDVKAEIPLSGLALDIKPL